MKDRGCKVVRIPIEDREADPMDPGKELPPIGVVVIIMPPTVVSKTRRETGAADAPSPNPGREAIKPLPLPLYGR